MDMEKMIRGIVEKNFKESREKLILIEVEGVAGGGSVRLKLDGVGAMRSIIIDPVLGQDISVLQDLILAAFQDARNKLEKEIKQFPF